MSVPDSDAKRPAGHTLESWRQMGRERLVSGRSLFVVDSADASSACRARPALLLLHGFPTSSWDWHYQWDALVCHFRVVAFDMLGFGYSEKPRGHRYSIHEQADLAAQLIADLDVEQVGLLAHDYGDTVAQELMARFRHTGSPRVQAACFLNGGLFPETHRARLVQKLLVGPAGGLFVRAFGRRALDKNLTGVFGRNTPPTPTELANFWELIEYNDGRRNLHRLMWYIRDRKEHRTRWIEALTRTDVPLMLINGSSDPVSGAHMVARYRELVGKGEIVELTDIGHYPQLEAPGEVTRHALAFFEETLLT